MIRANEITFYELLTKDNHAQIRVPDYQRGYSWDSENVQDFFDDLVNFLESKAHQNSTHSYFLGPIVLMPGPASDDYSYIVDGQQRMATFIILIAVIRDLSLAQRNLEGEAFANELHSAFLRSLGPNEGHRYSVLLGDLDQPFFKAFVQNVNRVANQIPRNKSNGLIKSARNLLEKNLRDKLLSVEDKIGYLKKFCACTTKSVVMIAISVHGEREAMNVFERINVRGKPLSEADLIRHRLISSSNKGERNKVRRCWDDLEQLLGTNGPSMDQFLRHMWISRNGETPASKLYDEISSYLDRNNTSPLDFANNCVNDCRIYSTLVNKDDKDLHFDSRLPVWTVITTFGVKQSLPLLLSAYRRFEKTREFSVIARNIESLVIRHQLLADLDPKVLHQTFSLAAVKINDASSKEKALALALKAFWSIDPAVSQLVNGVKRPMRVKNLQALYVLRQLENHYSHSDGSLMAHATLEHIFPKAAAPPKWSLAQIKLLSPFLNHIGNLALLAGAGNSSAGNKAYGKKKSIYRQSALKLTSEIADESNSWGRAPLLRRAEKLARLANERWRIER